MLLLKQFSISINNNTGSNFLALKISFERIELWAYQLTGRNFPRDTIPTSSVAFPVLFIIKKFDASKIITIKFIRVFNPEQTFIVYKFNSINFF